MTTIIMIPIIWTLGSFLLGCYYRFRWHQDPDWFGPESENDWVWASRPGRPKMKLDEVVIAGSPGLTIREGAVRNAWHKSLFWPIVLLWRVTFAPIIYVFRAIFLFLGDFAGNIDRFLKRLATPAAAKEKENPTYRDSAKE